MVDQDRYDKDQAPAGTVPKPGVSTDQAPDSLRAAIREVRDRIVTVIAEMDHARLQEIPSIKAEYAVRIGCWETQLLQAELACRKAKRRLQLMRAQANQGVRPDAAAVTAQVDAELDGWTGKVAQALRHQTEALAYASSMVPLSPADDRRLRRLYHVLACRLHPDLHPSEVERIEGLFQIARNAYKTGNLEVLESLEVSSRCYERKGDGLEELDSEDLACALELAQVELAMRQEDLAKLRQEPIFEVGRRLQDPDWLARTVASIKASIEEFDQARQDFETRITRLLGEE